MRGLWYALAFLLLAGAASAHSPYFGKDVLCQDDGWTMRLLFGDGIIAADPAAAIVLDEAGHVLAFQNLSASPFPLLGEDCRIWSWGFSKGYTPLPESFQRGPLLTGQDDDARAARWQYEPGFRKGESFGFAPVTDEVSGSLILASEIVFRWRGVVFFALLGLIPAGLIYAMVGAMGSGWARPLGYGIGVVLALGVWGILLLFLTVFGEMSPILAGVIVLLVCTMWVFAGGMSAWRKTPEAN